VAEDGAPGGVGDSSVVWVCCMPMEESQRERRRTGSGDTVLGRGKATTNHNRQCQEGDSRGTSEAVQAGEPTGAPGLALVE
jgi:hypothetical protein